MVVVGQHKTSTPGGNPGRSPFAPSISRCLSLKGFLSSRPCSKIEGRTFKVRHFMLTVHFMPVLKTILTRMNNKNSRLENGALFALLFKLFVEKT
jgi:hypothetical protein